MLGVGNEEPTSTWTVGECISPFPFLTATDYSGLSLIYKIQAGL